MLQNLNVIKLAGELAQHASSRQATVARNIANIDTPGFKAKDTLNFDEHVARLGSLRSNSDSLRTSRDGHVARSPQAAYFETVTDRSIEQKPNGNTVSIENETLKSIEAERAHSRALAIYQSTMTILKTSIGRGR